MVVREISLGQRRNDVDRLRMRSISPIPKKEYIEWWFKTVCLAFWSNKDKRDLFKIAFYQVFHNFNVNLRKNEGFLTCIPCIAIPEYGVNRTHPRAKVLCMVSVGSGGIQHSEVTDRRNLTIIELIVIYKNTFDKRSGQNVPIAKCKKSRKYIAKCSWNQQSLDWNH